MPFLFPSEGWVSHDEVNAIFVPDFTKRKSQRILWIDLRILEAMEQQVHLAEKIGQGFGFDAIERPALEAAIVVCFL